jgi:uncharacterized protein
MRKNIVLDTNTVMSATLFPKSITRQAFDKAYDYFQIVCSQKTFTELETVSLRPKFNKYMPENERLLVVEGFKKKVIFIEPTETITDFRDSKDNKFLELAVASDAQFIVTGDIDLLVLNPYRGITILKSGDFLALELV